MEALPLVYGGIGNFLCSNFHPVLVTNAKSMRRWIAGLGKYECDDGKRNLGPSVAEKKMAGSSKKASALLGGVTGLAGGI